MANLLLSTIVRVGNVEDDSHLLRRSTMGKNKKSGNGRETPGTPNKGDPKKPKTGASPARIKEKEEKMDYLLTGENTGTDGTLNTGKVNGGDENGGEDVVMEEETNGNDTDGIVICGESTDSDEIVDIGDDGDNEGEGDDVNGDEGGDEKVDEGGDGNGDEGSDEAGDEGGNGEGSKNPDQNGDSNDNGKNGEENNGNTEGSESSCEDSDVDVIGIKPPPTLKRHTKVESLEEVSLPSLENSNTLSANAGTKANVPPAASANYSIKSHAVRPLPKNGMWEKLLTSVKISAIPFTTYLGVEDSDGTDLHSLSLRLRELFVILQKGRRAEPSVSALTLLFKNVVSRDRVKFGNTKQGDLVFEKDNEPRVVVHRLIAGCAMTPANKLFGDVMQDGLIRPVWCAKIWRAAMDTVGQHFVEPIKTHTQTTITFAFPPKVSPEKNNREDSVIIDSSDKKSNNKNSKNTNRKKRDNKKNNKKNRKTKSDEDDGDNYTQTRMTLDNFRSRRRYSLVLGCAKDGTPNERWQSLYDSLSFWVDSVNSVSDDIFIVPWYNRDADRKDLILLNDAAEVNELSKIQISRLLPNCKPPGNSKDKVYTNVRLASNNNFEERMEECMRDYFYSTIGGMYISLLSDAERPVSIGLMIYSGNYSDAKADQRITNKYFKNKGQSIEVGFKVRKVAKNQIDGVTIDYDERDLNGDPINFYCKSCFVIMVEADYKDASRAKRMMIDAFNNKNEAQPGGLKYRFLPELSRMTVSEYGSAKYGLLWKKHVLYNNSLKVLRNDKIASLDVCIDYNGGKVTLREWLGSETNSKNESIFKGMRKPPSWDFNGGTDIVFVCLPLDFNRVISRLAGLLPRAKGIFGNEIRHWFKEQALEEIVDVQFDDNGNFVSSGDERMLDFLLEEERGVSIELPDNFGINNDDDDDPMDEDDSGNMDDAKSAKSAISFQSELGFEEEGFSNISNIGSFTSNGTGITSDLTDTSSGMVRTLTLENERLKEQVRQSELPSTGVDQLAQLQQLVLQLQEENKRLKSPPLAEGSSDFPAGHNHQETGGDVNG